MSILFEDLKSNPKDVLSEMFEVLKIPESQLSDALEAMRHDSQNDILCQRGGNKLRRKIKDKEWKQFDQVFHIYDVPISIHMEFDQFRKLIKGV